MLYRKLTIALALALAGVAAVAAPGGPGYGPGPGAQEGRGWCRANPDECVAQRKAHHEEHFKVADADHDGVLTKSEADKAMPGVAWRFETLDVDKDGKVTLAESEAARPGGMGPGARGHGRGYGRGMGPGMGPCMQQQPEAAPAPQK